MLKKFLVVLVIFAAFMFMIAAPSIAASERKEDLEEKGYTESIGQQAKSFFSEDWEMQTRLNILFGYDNNVHLNPERRGSEFFETYFKTNLIKTLSDDLKWMLGYKFLNLAYTGSSTSTFYKNTATMGLEKEFLNRTTGYTDFSFNWVDYPNDDDGNYFGYSYDIGFNHKITNTIYQKFEYRFLYKDYLSRDIRDTSNTIESKKRGDVRHGTYIELGKFFKKVLANVYYDYFRNDSNEGYQQYYDYNSHKIGSSATYIFNKKWVGYLSFAHQWKFYEDRGTVADPTITADDKTWLGNASLFYKINSSSSVGVNYAYRENASNEPSQKYSSSVISAGWFHKF